MKITGPWITSTAAQSVCRMLMDHGYQAYFVGGCVRNDLMGLPVNDLDISTDAKPETVLKLARAAGLTAVPTGIDHGTITVIADKIPFEITTFRRDVETDGRHARVEFSTDIAQDAARRDFTMNALYADAAGNIVDPLGGIDDLRARRVRFINNPHDRITEDYLRILRFFRFSAIYGDPELGFDADALDAISQNLDGIAGLSRERIGSEVLKLLAADDPAPAVATMRTTGVLMAVLGAVDDRALGPLIHFETELGLSPDPIRRLAVLSPTGATDALRLSKAQAKALDLYATLMGDMTDVAEIAYRYGADVALSTAALRAAIFETPPTPQTALRVALGAGALFPITAADIIDRVQGAALGRELRRLETLWIASDFTLNRDDLLAQ